MYKCSECGTEYEVKPDYCDCGNDTFEEVTLNTEVKKETAQSTTKTQIPKLEPKITQKKESEATPNTIPQTIEKKQEQYDYKRLKEFFDPISTVIFLLCVIASIFILMWKTSNTEQDLSSNKSPEVAKEEQIISDIPSIDNFWDNSSAQKAQIPVTPEKEEPKIVQMVEQVFKPQKNENLNKKDKTINNINKPASTKQQETKNQTQTKSPSVSSTQNSSAKTAQTTPSQSITDLTNRVKNNIQYSNTSSSTTSNTPQKSNTTSNNSISAATIPVQKTTQTQTQTQSAPTIRTSNTNTGSSAASTTNQTVVKARDIAAEKQELANYKSSLRNFIGRKIDFTKVVGDGDCSLSFKINSTGKLINRAFTKQSSNITLNDAVYTAMNAASSYNPPPAGYNNETINLNIRFYNGNFEISLY